MCKAINPREGSMVLEYVFINTSFHNILELMWVMYGMNTVVDSAFMHCILYNGCV